jgi:hypothetical protein
VPGRRQSREILIRAIRGRDLDVPAEFHGLKLQYPSRHSSARETVSPRSTAPCTRSARRAGSVPHGGGVAGCIEAVDAPAGMSIATALLVRTAGREPIRTWIRIG